MVEGVESVEGVERRDEAQLRARVLRFVTQEVYPREQALASAAPGQRALWLGELMQRAKADGLWALGHPRALGGHGLSFMEYVTINEVIGRSHWAMQALGTLSLQDSLMLQAHASASVRERYLARLVAGEITPSFAMTEPEVASSDPTQLEAAAELRDGEWVISGRKWFTTGAREAAFTTVMCRTEGGASGSTLESSGHRDFSLILVPTDAPGYRVVRETPVLGMLGGHCEIALEGVRVPYESLIGARGAGFAVAQERLGPGRIFHCMRWLGQAQRAFDLMCARMQSRRAFGELLADKALLQSFVFESAAEISACRMLTLAAARKLDSGGQARDEISVVKVLGARMLHNVIDRAVQVFGAAGLTDDSALSGMYRHAREARIYDGPDEVHVLAVAKRMLAHYREQGAGFDFGAQG